jgi:hypothetical protein
MQLGASGGLIAAVRPVVATVYDTTKLPDAMQSFGTTSGDV